MKNLICLVIVLILIFCSATVFAFDVPDTIRVGLCYGSNARTYIDLFSNEGFDVGYYENNVLVPLWSTDETTAVVAVTSGTVYISYGYATYEEAASVSEGGFVMYTNGSFYKAYSEPRDGFGAYTLKEGSMALKFGGVTVFVADRTDMGMCGRNNLTMIDGYSYRGGAEMRYYGSGLMTVINIVGFTDYICGVVPYEMSSSFHPEALKVQAICARNYAVVSMGNYYSYGFDVTDDTYCQAYGGLAAESEKTNQAVRDTDGMMLMYNGEPAQTFFSSMSGGHTEASENVWATAIPYLCGVPDPYEDTENINGGLWQVELTPEEISAKAAAWGRPVGEVTNMYVAEYTKAGGVLRLVIEGTAGTVEFTKDECRNLFVLRSQKYTVSAPGVEQKEETVRTVVGFNDIPRPSRYPMTPMAVNADRYPTFSEACRTNVMSYIVETVVKTQTASGSDKYILSGRGYGHGLGMSQWGAECMAQAGIGYEEILLHYFPGTYLQKD